MTRSLLQVAALGEIRAFGDDRESEPCGEFADELSIGARLVCSKLMVEMEHGEADVPELVKDVEEADGIRAAGHRYADTLVGGEHRVTLDGRGDALEQGVQLSHCTAGVVH